MKIQLQWATKDPQPWQEVDSGQWASLPKKDVPKAGQLGGTNNTLGWIRNVSVQGLTTEGYDHVAIEEITIGLDSGVRLTTWNDDPDDYPVGERQAIVWTILPLAPDPNLGMAINTRQSCVRYCEGPRYTRLVVSPPQKTTIRSWTEFVSPPAAVVRHGVWLERTKFDAHVAAAPQAEWGWMHWNEHLPVSECEIAPDGRRVLKEQRKQGRYKQAASTITYYQRNTARAIGIATVYTNENASELSTAASGTQTVTTNSGVVNCWAFTTPVNQPNSADWPNGVYHAQWNCTAASTGLTYGASNDLGQLTGFGGRLAADLASSTGRMPSTAGNGEGSDFSGTGLKLSSSDTTDLAAGSADERYAVFCSATGDSHGDAITLTLNTTDSYADGPWSSGVAISPGVGAITLTGNAPSVFVLDAKAVSTGLGQLALAGQAPTLTVTENQFAAPGVGELVITGQAPTVAKTDNVFITAALGELTLTGYEPTVSKHITTGLGELTFTAYAPGISVTSGTNITTALGELVLAGNAPSLAVTDNVFITAGVGALEIAGQAPTITKTDHVFISPGVGSLTIAGYAPSVASTAHVSITSALGELTLTSSAPSIAVTDNVFVTLNTGALELAGYAPTVAKTDNVFITAGLGALTLDGFAPQVGGNFAVTPDVGSLVLGGLAPTVAKTDHVSISAGLGELVLTGQAPSISVTANVFTTTDLGQLVLTGAAPSIAVTSNVFVDTGLAELTITGYSPTAVVSAGGNVSVNPGLGALTITGLVPSLAVSGGSVVTFFTGVSTADGVTHFKGVSRPTVQLADAGGGTYTVTKTHELSGNFKPDALDRETYLIDGELP